MIARNLLTWARRSAPDAALGRAVLSISAVALSAAGLAACSGTSAPKADPPAAAPATSSAPAPGVTASTAAPSASAQVSGPDVCSVVTAAQVASITNDVVEETARGQLGPNATCAYTLSDSVIQVQVAAAGSAVSYPSFNAQVTNGADPADSAISVPGLGQQSVASTVGVAAQTPKYAVLVLNQRGTVSGQLGDDVSIAKAAIARLG